MQQTETYKLNLIETSDVFSPEPLNGNARALETQLARVDAALDTKAEQTEVARVESETAAALDAKADQTALETLTGRVGTLEAGRLMYKLGEYRGSGSYGYPGANRLDFDFKPLLVIVYDTYTYTNGGIPWIRDQTLSVDNLYNRSGMEVFLTWEDKAVLWYTTTAERQLNRSGVLYRYLAIGVAE